MEYVDKWFLPDYGHVWVSEVFCVNGPHTFGDAWILSLWCPLCGEKQQVHRYNS